jgi:hypothetical protein
MKWVIIPADNDPPQAIGMLMGCSGSRFSLIV